MVDLHASWRPPSGETLSVIITLLLKGFHHHKDLSSASHSPTSTRWVIYNGSDGEAGREAVSFQMTLTHCLMTGGNHTHTHTHTHTLLCHYPPTNRRTKLITLITAIREREREVGGGGGGMF